MSTSSFIALRGVLPSSGLKAQYQKTLTALTDKMRADLLALLRSRQEEITAPGLARDARPRSGIEEALAAFFDAWDRKFDAFAAIRARRMAAKANTSATRQLYNSLREAGLTVGFRNTERVSAAIDDIVSENVSLIKSIPEKLRGEVRESVERSVRKGRDMAAIVREVEGRCRVSHNRAVTIARDQTNKATEAISRERCLELGITEGIWMHRSGSKVPRSTHKAMNGTRFSLSGGLYDADVGHAVRPGELINCHCTYRPVLPGLAGGKKP
ncbi:MAG: hypothetical protein LBH65_05035 [Desulfovibrio sp.]|jgi:SPP1 gp7 family putative phage head morphogenesis protein|nr:hypothetical protein [Desulfovibrio sp.]